MLSKRDRLKEEGVLVAEESGALAFTKDCLFSSPSFAAAVVMGRSANGLVEWKDPSGKTIKENEAAGTP